MTTRTRALQARNPLLETLGWLALLLSLALLSPGLTLEAAAEPTATGLHAEGPSCSGASANSEAGALDLQRRVAQLREQLRAQEAARGPSSEAGDVVVLNNSGFNYQPSARPPADPSPDR